MAETYTYISPPPPLLSGTVQRESDHAFIPCDLENMDYQGFLLWLNEGNTAPEGWTGPTNTSSTG